VIDLSVVIVSFNTREILARTLDAVLADCSTLAAEIIVIDNASADGSAAMVRERYPAIRLVANAANRFYTAANNQGMSKAGGRCVLVLNSDAVPEPGTLPEMLAYMDAHPRVGALTPRMRFPDGRLQRNCAGQWTYELLLLEYTPWRFVKPGRRRRALSEFWYADWDRTTTRDVDVIPGSCIMTRRDVIAQVGGFDERFLLYFAEDDWCWRVRRAGWTVVYAAIGGVIHPEGASTAGVARLARRIYFADMVAFAAKHFGPARAGWLRVLSAPMRVALDFSSSARAH
jgi:GT2 family glycosyltransferase